MENRSIESVIENSSNLTITTAKKTVHSLADYLHIKGLYLTAKLSPSENPLTKPQNIEFVVNFLNESTHLKAYPFWKNLEREQKDTLVRYMTLRDEKEMQLMSKSSLKSADVYILLSGKALLSTVNKEAPGKKPRKLRMGAVFGPTDVFDSEKENTELVVSYSATVTSGTVLRIKYSDLYRAKYGDSSNEQVGEDRVSDEEASLRDVDQFGRAVLSADMNAFLRKNNLIATLPTDNAQKYISYGSIGREIPAQKREQDVIIILQGSVRVVLEKSILGVPEIQERKDAQPEVDEDNLKVGDPVSMTCKREGEPSSNFKMRNIPLCLLEQGAVLLMDEEMLQRVASHQPEEVNADASDEHEEVGLPSLPNFQRNPRGDHDQRRENAYVPHLTLHFDKPTMYLCIPLRRIRNALQNESYQTNLVIRGEMKLACSTLAERIEKLKPWLAAHRVVTTKIRKQRVAPSAPSPADLSCNGDIESGKTDLIGTFSETAFAREQELRPLTANSTKSDTGETDSYS